MEDTNTKSMQNSTKFPAKLQYNDAAVDFVAEVLMGWGVDKKLINSFRICVEEIFVNVASYAYGNGEGDVEIVIENKDNSIFLTFKDTGVEFNPVDRDDPDITAGIDERGIGGLGLFMVKQMMDEVYYERIEQTNCLTLKKVINK